MPEHAGGVVRIYQTGAELETAGPGGVRVPIPLSLIVNREYILYNEITEIWEGGVCMTAEAIKMIEELPEDTLRIAVPYIRNLRIKQKTEIADIGANLRALDEI